MSPRQRQSLDFKYPTYRDLPFKSADKWLEGKRHDDEAEGFWRIHNNLYDLSNFVDTHPGGAMWLELTKGTDITEAFECHHITTLPEEVLTKYFIRQAKSPRNSPFSFEENGFYRTLKRNIRSALKDVPKNISKKSDYTTDGLCIATYIFAILAAGLWSFTCAIISGVCLTFCTIAAHNYFHKRDNIRMYYFNLSLMQFREWRITHALSHHLFPNTILDFEISFLEPLIEYLPRPKSFLVKYISWIYVFVVWISIFFFSFVKRIAQIVVEKEASRLQWADFVPFTLPLAMYYFGGQSMLATLGMWFAIIEIGSLSFGMIGFNAAHHHPDIFHEGDAPRKKRGIDWGIHQLDAVADRHEITGNPFLVLTFFGDHALHHMFPTLDHAVLNYLYPTLKDTMKQFDVDIRMQSQLELIKGQFLQLSREEKNDKPPGIKIN